MNISNNINNYIFANKEQKYTIKNFDYFSTEYRISSDVLLTELSDYTIMIDMVKKLEKNKIIIDVGANCGLFCVPISLLGYTTYAFEPISMNVELLNHNKRDNNCNTLTIINSALMDFDGYKDIFIPYCSDNTSFDEFVAISNMSKKEFITENVKCETFDKWISENKISNVVFIKMDVQGFEYNVIKGMNKFLEESNDLYILLEWDDNHTKKAGYTLNEIYEFLTLKGFKDIKSFSNDKLFYKN